MMRPGDVLYVPRGILHDAASQGAQCSLHLTIGLLGQSWGDALRAALDVMEREDPALRQAFPIWRLAEGGISDELVQEAAKRLSALGAANVMELMSQQAADEARDRADADGQPRADRSDGVADRLALSLRHRASFRGTAPGRERRNALGRRQHQAHG